MLFLIYLVRYNIMRRPWIIYILIFIIIICILSSVMDVSTEEFSDTSTPQIDYYVISLKNNEKRMKNIEEQQSKMSSKLNIFDAVNGAEIDIENIKDPVIDNNFSQPTKPPSSSNLENSKIRKREIGCYLSHYNLYRKIESEQKWNGYTVIFEDDFVIKEDAFEEQLKRALQDLAANDFDILYIFNHTNNIGESVTNNVCKTDKNKNLYGTSAYMVKNKNVRKILEETKQMNAPIDYRLQESIKHDKIIAYTVCPFLSNTNSEIESTIQIK